MSEISAYGYSVYDKGFYFRGKIYIPSFQNYYGVSAYTPLNVNPFTATPVDYQTIMLQWQQPQTGVPGEYIMEFRLLSSRYGFPVDENDGNILIDSSTFPGTAYADQNIIPGQLYYYGIYILNQGIWNRAGFAACLAPYDYDSGDRMFNLLPTYYRELTDTELTQVTLDDSTLQTYLDVIGWGMDYIRTQADLYARHLNDPMFMPLGDLVNLAGELGMPYEPELPGYLTRKALANWATVCGQRGTPEGLAENISLLTGYPVDLRVGRNQMLENDQAIPVSPAPPAWNACLAYYPGDMVSYQGYLYTCLVGATQTTGQIHTGGAPDPGLGQPPTGNTSSNTYWQCIQNTVDPGATLFNPDTQGQVNTWEALYPALDAGGSYAYPAGVLANTLGVPDPLDASDWTHNCFSVFNKAGTTQDIWLRSVSRIATDMTGTNTNVVPDIIQAVGDGVPVGRIQMSTHLYDPTVRYATDSIVIYDGMLFQAARASTNAVPPSAGTPVNQNFTFESGVTPWNAFDGATIVQSSTDAFQGTYSMKLTPNGTTANPGAYSESITVIPGAVYELSSWVFIPASWNGAQIGMNWYDGFGQYISSTGWPFVNVAASTWTQVSTSVTAPANAATGILVVQLNGTPASSVVSYWDAVSVSCWQTPEWALLSPDNRLRFMISGYTAQSLTTSSNQTCQVIPFIEWYDETGTIISSNNQYRVFPRVATPGTPGICPNLTFDSFTTGQGTYLNGRMADTQDQQWQTLTGSWLISGYFGGCAYPSVLGSRTMSVCSGLPGTSGNPVFLAVTYASAPQSGQDAGIAFRVVSTSSYWRAGMTGLYLITSGTAALQATYSTACQPGDRLTVYLLGNTITVYCNGIQVAQVTNSANASATLHGIVVENTGV